MLKKAIIYILSFCLFLILSCSVSGEKKCNKLKRGEFYYKSKVAFEGSSIKRYDSMQTVTDKATGREQKERIEWLDPCTYMLYALPENDSLFPVKVKILDVADRYYTVHISSQQYKTSFNDTVWIVGLIGGFKALSETFR